MGLYNRNGLESAVDSGPFALLLKPPGGLPTTWRFRPIEHKVKVLAKDEARVPWTVEVINRSGSRISHQSIQDGVRQVLAQHQAPAGVVAVLVTDDAEMSDLNARFRNLAESTDVLSFPSEFPGVLGDIAISAPYAARQAAARKVSLKQELGYLAIHGALHLLGFDDETMEDRREMVEQMNRAATAAGLKSDPQWSSLLHGDEE